MANYIPMSPSRRRRKWLLLALLAAIGSVACQNSAAPPFAPAPTPSPLAVEIVTQDLTVGENRLAMVVLEEGRLIREGQVQLVFYYLKDPQPTVRAQVSAAPRIDRHEHANPADHAETVFYITSVNFDQSGAWGMEVQVAQPNQPTKAVRLALEVRSQPLAPAVGSAAPPSKSKTLRDAPPEQLSSLLPLDPDLYSLSIAEALATGRPFLVVFATPAFCTSRTCGPEMHVVEHLKEHYRDRMHFIHVEVYDNPHEMAQDPNKGRLSPVVLEWRLPSEPWVFLVDGNGTIAARYEGFVTLEEIEPAVERLLQ